MQNVQYVAIGLRAGDERSELIARGAPIQPTKGRVVEVVAQQPPGFVEDLTLLAVEVYDDVGADMQLGLVAGRELADYYLPGVEKVEALAVGRELGRPLAARPRRNLARRLVGAWLVERDAP